LCQVWSLIEPDSEPVKYLVTDSFALQYDDWSVEVDGFLSRSYHSTDGWRGYHETKIEGFIELKDLTGWTTGYTDSSVSRKEFLNNWVQALFEGRLNPPCEVGICFDPTSNVFSTAVGIWTKEDDADTFKEWLGGDYDTLSNALG
jgi:hypothetical protein